MLEISFTLGMTCGDGEPSRYVLTYKGDITEYDSEDREIEVGKVEALVVQRGRMINERASTYDAMDCHSGDAYTIYVALFDAGTDDWEESIENFYDGILESDLLVVQCLELKPEHRGKGKGVEVVREVIATLGRSCGLVACFPHPLQYSVSDTIYPKKDFKAAYAKVVQFWSGLGFQKVPNTGVYTFNPNLTVQPRRRVRRCSSVAEQSHGKRPTRVRFPASAPKG